MKKIAIIGYSGHADIAANILLQMFNQCQTDNLLNLARCADSIDNIPSSSFM